MAAPQDQIEYVPLSGGLDLQTSSLTIKPGRALDLHNFEPAPGGGYARMAGYEKYIGPYSPAAYTLYSMTVDDASGLGDPSAADIPLVGTTSAAEGDLAAKEGNTLYFVYYFNDPLPPFQNGETISGVVPTCTITSAPVEVTDATRHASMRAWMRATMIPGYVTGAIIDATEPGGSGPILGICPSPLGASTLAFRNNAAGTAVEIWRAADDEASGWQNMTSLFGLGNPGILWFDGGTGMSTIANGATVTGGTSGATMVLHWTPIIQSGTDGGSNSAGYLVGTVTGTFVDNELLKVGGATKGVANGTSTTHTISPGGKYQFVRANFFGASNNDFIFGCDGVNPAFMLTNLVNGFIPILHPQTAIAGQPEYNKPKYIEAHKNYLFLSFPGGSLQHSVLGDPVCFNGFLGANEFAIGAEITGLKSTTGGGLAVYTRRKTQLLEGSSTADWALRTISEKAGAIDYTTQSLGQVFMLDDFGLTTLQRVQSFGDFDPVPLSRQIQRALTEKIIAPTSALVGVSNVVGSVAIREKNQYRVFFDDGSGVLFYMDESGKAQAATFTVGFTPSYVTVLSMADGTERVMAGDTNGNVYRLERGYSQEGSAIYAVCRLPYNHAKSPRQRKSYRQMELETALSRATDSSDVSLTIYTELDFGSIDNSTISATGADIGQGMQWEIVDGSTTYWTTAQEKATSVPLEGVGNNISFIIVNNQNDAGPFTLQGLVLRYRPRRPDRS